MELVIILVMSALMPITAIAAFIIGFNVNASRKIFVKPKKHEPSEDEIMLDRIDKATI